MSNVGVKRIAFTCDSMVYEGDTGCTYKGKTYRCLKCIFKECRIINSTVLKKIGKACPV